VNDEQAAERLIQSAYAAFKHIRENLVSHFALSTDREEIIIAQALSQHAKHLQVHQIEQTSLDPFKFICWIGGCLLNGLEKGDGNEFQCGVIIDAILHTLEEQLILESKATLILPNTSAELLKRMLLQENANNGAHGIWMNGLYVAFHCSVATHAEGQRRKASFD
jgi:hypothetical protein